MFNQIASTERIREIRNYIESADRMLRDTAQDKEPNLVVLQTQLQMALMVINQILIVRNAKELGLPLGDESPAPEATEDTPSTTDLPFYTPGLN